MYFVKQRFNFEFIFNKYITVIYLFFKWRSTFDIIFFLFAYTHIYNIIDTTINCFRQSTVVT